jgi:hypothetical protein
MLAAQIDRDDPGLRRQHARGSRPGRAEHAHDAGGADLARFSQAELTLGYQAITYNRGTIS